MIARPPYSGSIGPATVGGGGGTSEILAAQVLDWEPEESISDVGATPNVLNIEVFN